VSSELNRAERDVQEHSVALKKPLGLRDLVLTQILFVVGSTWVGAAAKLGHICSFGCSRFYFFTFRKPRW